MNIKISFTLNTIKGEIKISDLAFGFTVWVITVSILAQEFKLTLTVSDSVYLFTLSMSFEISKLVIVKTVHVK